MDPAYLIAPLVGGALALGLRLPPLIGFLAAGFALNLMGYKGTEALDHIADLGVTLLLFTIGLKLNIRTLLRPQVWGTATLHAALSTLVVVLPLSAVKLTGLALLRDADWQALFLIAFALSFSSTVFAVKVLEDRAENTSLYGRTAIGVLVMQDIFAVVYITASTGKLPSPWAFLLLLLIPGTWLLHRLLTFVGHGEMLVLLGVVMALVVGYAFFDALNLKGDLGALIVGMLLASHKSAYELSRALFNLKELFLVGFFLTIGLTGLPTWETTLMAVLLLLALPLQAALYLVFFAAFRLRWRTSVLAAATLATYSEFGLIVAVLAEENGLLSGDWLVALSLAVALSFIVAALLNKNAHALFAWMERWLPKQDPAKLDPADQPISVGNAEAIVLGMGRVGRGAYDRLREEYGLRVLGVDTDENVILGLRERGYMVIEADATDDDFWEKTVLDKSLQLVILAMPVPESNHFALTCLRGQGFTGRVAAIAQYSDEVDYLATDGDVAVFHLYKGAGTALADTAMEPGEGT